MRSPAGVGIPTTTPFSVRDERLGGAHCARRTVTHGGETELMQKDDQIRREACRTNSGGDGDRGRGPSACQTVWGAECTWRSTAGVNAASASGVAFTEAAAATVAQHVNAGEPSPW